MHRRWGRKDVADRRQARRDREDSCPRLRDEVPELTTLHFEVSVSREGVPLPGETHVRRFVVSQAPAMFALRCTDPECRDGGHDVTAAVLRALRAGLERFEIEDACSGQMASAECGRVAGIVGIASYGPKDR